MCDSLGSTEQFCRGTREAGRCRCRLGGRRPVAVRKNSDGGAREGGSRPAATAQGKGAAGGEDEEELSSLDLEYASLLEHRRSVQRAAVPDSDGVKGGAVGRAWGQV